MYFVRFIVSFKHRVFNALYALYIEFQIYRI